MEKKYQVFVSSTYTDLKEERQNITNILLMADCIPAGMEAFVAADDEQFDPGELKYTMSTDEEVTVTSESNEYNFNMPDADIVGIYIEAINNYN